MTQNIYDDPRFFAGYSQLGRSIQGLSGAPEWPALRAMLPDIKGRRVLDLGCGFGWFCRWARENGAAHATGVDLSEKMLERAARDTDDPCIRYLRGDLETALLPEDAFDLVYSSLAFHYVERLDDLFARIYRTLAPGGALVFSAEHPIYTAPRRPGWTVGADGAKTWPLDNYLIEGPRMTDWLAEGVIKRHRLISTYVTMLLRQGFALTHLDEWSPSAAQIAARPELAEERERPMFVLMSARR